MKITMYELLGMVKEDKAPKKIKWNDLIYEKSKYNATPRGYYYRINGGIKLWLLDEINSLNDTVEILEEEKKTPEKLPEFIHSDSLNYMTCNIMFETLTNKYNDLIDYLDYLKSKGE